MNKERLIIKSLVNVGLFVVLVLVFGFSVKAEDKADTDDSYLIRKEWKADELIQNDTLKKYNEPKRIVFVEISKLTKSKETKEHVKELYYFFAFKMGLGDIPIHMVMDDTGVLYEGRAMGADSVIPIDGYEKGDVVVVYSGAVLSDENKEKFSESYKKVLTMVGVDPSKSVVKKLNLDLDLVDKKSKVYLSEQAEDEFVKSFSVLNAEISKTWTKVEREYSLELVKVNYEKSPTVGTPADIQIEVKNTGVNNIYYDGESELFAVTDEKFDHESEFYYDKSWATRSRVPIMSETNSILPVGKTMIFTFKVNIPLESGELSDKFILVNKRGDKYEAAKFETKFNLSLGNKKVVEVKENEYGFLRVRKEPRGSAEELGKVLPGERYEWLERTDTGYISIKLKDGSIGYVVGSYVKVVQ